LVTSPVTLPVGVCAAAAHGSPSNAKPTAAAAIHRPARAALPSMEERPL